MAPRLPRLGAKCNQLLGPNFEQARYKLWKAGLIQCREGGWYVKP